MQIYYIGLIRTTGGKSLELSAAKELSSFSFFERSSINQFMTFLAETIAERTDAGQRQSVEEKGYICHAYTRSDGLSCAVITDKEYPIRPAHTLMNKVVDEYLSLHPASEWSSITATTAALHYDALDTYIKKYQNPSQADSIMKVQQELDETKVVLHKTIESVLARGEKLDSLVNKSEALSSTSKMFYKQAKQTNSCCVII